MKMKSKSEMSVAGRRERKRGVRMYGNATIITSSKAAVVMGEKKLSFPFRLEYAKENGLAFTFLFFVPIRTLLEAVRFI